MNLNNIKNLYQDIGFNSKSVDKRIAQIQMLTKCNPLKSAFKTGGGVAVGFDSLFGPEVSPTLCPIVAKDIDEANAIGQHLLNKYRSRLMDADTYAFDIPSSGIPTPILTIWTTRTIEEMFKTNTLSLVAGAWQQGAPGVEEIKIPTVGFLGNPAIYSDLSMNGGTSVNFNWVTRNIAYFEDTLVWGDMQQAQFGLAKIDYVNKIREAMAILVTQFQNDLGFQGYTGIPSGDNPQLFGILNEPNLGAAISLPVDGQIPGTLIPTTAWYGKDYLQIARDVQLLIQNVLTKAKGNASVQSTNNNTPFKLCIPPSAEAALATPNALGSKSVGAWLRETYPNMTIEIIPNFEAELVTTGVQTGQTVVMVLFQHPKTGEMPYDELFVTKWQGHRPVPMASAIAEKMSFGLGGVILKYPLLVAYAYGV